MINQLVAVVRELYLAEGWGTCAMQDNIMCSEPAKFCGAWIVSEGSVLYTSSSATNRSSSYEELSHHAMQ